MDDTVNDFLAGLQHCFCDLNDPRVQGRCDHRLIDLLAISVLAVMSGAEDWPDMEEFGRRRQPWLETFLELPHGIPSHDTFRRVFGLLDRTQFATCLFRWTQALHEATGGKLIAIDGKTLRRSLSKKSGRAPLHLVTAWSSENALTLGQVACEEKSNEITAIPELVKLLNIKGCTITIDAMGCQKDIAEQIRQQKGHYVLALKGNQPGLEADMLQLHEQGMETNFKGMTQDSHETTETSHGRTTRRTYQAISIPLKHKQRGIWKDLCTLVIATCCRIQDGTESWGTRLYVSSHGPRAKQLANAIRRHWSI
jgi:predicted transposase YbfD/YdcC